MSLSESPLQSRHWQTINQWRQQLHRQPSRNLLLRLVIGTMTLVVSASAYWSYQVVRTLMLENLKAKALLEVQQGVSEIDQWLIARKSEVETIANAPVVKTLDISAINPYIQRLVTQQANFFKYAVGFADGSYYNSTHGTLTDKSIRDRIYFQRAMAGRQHVSDPIISRTTGIHQINIASPIGDTSKHKGSSNHASGVFIGSVSIHKVTTIVNQLRYGSNSYPFALNSDGAAITHPYTELMTTKEKPASSFLTSTNLELAEIAQRMVNKQQGIELRTVDGQLQYVAYLPLQEANWSVALVIPRHNIEGQLRSLDLIALVVMSLTFTMIVLLWQVQAFEQKQLKKTKAAAESANQAKSDFLANMSHELRTPLNGILGYTQILHRGENLNLKQEKGLNIIYQSGQHLLMLINDVLDIAKIEACRLQLRPTLVHLPSFLGKVTDIIHIQAEQKGIEFVYLPSAYLPQHVYVDEKRLRQILSNLLGNAIKFTEQGGVTFRVVAQLSSNISSQVEPQIVCHIYFEVEDTGIGITPETITKIFHPFEQVSDPRYQGPKHQGSKHQGPKHQREGTGLGLAISQQIAHLMDSEIQVQSRLGKGSLFSLALALPLAEA